MNLSLAIRDLSHSLMAHTVWVPLNSYYFNSNDIGTKFDHLYYMVFPTNHMVKIRLTDVTGTRMKKDFSIRSWFISPADYHQHHGLPTKNSHFCPSVPAPAVLVLRARRMHKVSVQWIKLFIKHLYIPHKRTYLARIHGLKNDHKL